MHNANWLNAKQYTRLEESKFKMELKAIAHTQELVAMDLIV